MGEARHHRVLEGALERPPDFRVVQDLRRGAGEVAGRLVQHDEARPVGGRRPHDLRRRRVRQVAPDQRVRGRRQRIGGKRHAEPVAGVRAAVIVRGGRRIDGDVAGLELAAVVQDRRGVRVSEKEDRQAPLCDAEGDGARQALGAGLHPEAIEIDAHEARAKVAAAVDDGMHVGGAHCRLIGIGVVEGVDAARRHVHQLRLLNSRLSSVVKTAGRSVRNSVNVARHVWVLADSLASRL